MQCNVEPWRRWLLQWPWFMVRSIALLCVVAVCSSMGSGVLMPVGAAAAACWAAVAAAAE